MISEILITEIKKIKVVQKYQTFFFTEIQYLKGQKKNYMDAVIQITEKPIYKLQKYK